MGQNRFANLGNLSFFNSMKVFQTLFHYRWLVLLVALAAFLRLWQISSWQYFTYDQARDYLIVKRIIFDHKFTLVGPTVLAPGVYLPPFYYYSLVPFLWLFKFHLVGPDIYTAFLGTGAIVIFYFLVKDFFGELPALLAGLLFAFNPYLIQASRHAWNPNTIFFFTLLFALSFEGYWLKKQKIYLPLSAFSLSWALNLHYTVVVFLPLLGALFYKEFSEKRFSFYFWAGLGAFIIFISPLAFFEIRHSFPNLRGVVNFVGKQGSGLGLGERMTMVVVDAVKMPVTLVMGLNPEHNLTINPSHILLFDKVNIFSGDALVKLKLAFGLLVILFSLFSLVGDKHVPVLVKRIVALFFFSGLLIRLVFPPAAFYFYHYTFWFPFALLFLSGAFSSLLVLRSGKTVGIIVAILICYFAFHPNPLKNEVRNESYFLPAAEVIAKDYSPGDKITLAANLVDPFRWDHNALEYRYFLETVYRIPLENWEARNYKEANVLYLIDEGSLKEPLKLGGMEVEAFAPRRIEKMWTTQNGQKIYRMKR